MANMKRSKRLGGHPANSDPDVDKLYRTLKSSVELTAAFEDKLPASTFDVLKASTLGLMETYAQVTGKPSPIGLILDDMEEKVGL